MSRTGFVRLAVAMCSLIAVGGCADTPEKTASAPVDNALARAAVVCYQVGQLDQAVQQWKAGGPPLQDPGLFDGIAQNAAGIAQADGGPGSLANLERSTAAMKLRVERGEGSWVIDLVDAEKACIDLGLMATG